MSIVHSYRLQSDSLAIRTNGKGERHTVTVPSGTTVATVEGPIGGRRLVEVNWNGERVLIFADDLQHSEESFFSDSRTSLRGTGSTVDAKGSEGLEQALIEHSMDLAESNQELERFAFVAAHDLREPLRSIQATTELFLERNGSTLDEESARLLNFVLKGAERMNRLIKDLLDFATLGQEASIAEVDTKAVAGLALRELEDAIERSGAIIEIGSLPPININEGQLLRLFQNLIGNAIKYRKGDRPRIRISASSVEGELIFSVSDDGIGIEPEYHEQIFSPFRRLHGAAEYEGSGVGLAICKKVVALYNGRIWVESQPGTGSTFCFTIPDAGRKNEGVVDSVNSSETPSSSEGLSLAATG